MGVIILCLVATLLAFLIFNRYPSKVFPGDVLTAIVAILANLERFAVMLFLPYYVELLLKAKGGSSQSGWRKCLRGRLPRGEGEML
jgi:UDP-N-acetylmuramyl pentapeptide phosphotransferase/UDP-N-acetylglucosamine-1-phosphate transferase